MEQHSRQGLYRYRRTRIIGGVFAGLADKFGLHLWGMRIVAIGLVIMIDYHKAVFMLFLGEGELAAAYAFFGMGWATGLAILLYAVLWIVLPLRGPHKPAPNWERAK